MCCVCIEVPQQMCESAWGPDADRRDNGLISPRLEGSKFGAKSHLGWRQEDLSKAAGVGTATIRRIESANSSATSYVSTLSRIQASLEAAGVLFIDDDGSAGIG